MSEELKPCPVCTSIAVEKELYQGPQPLAVCTDCGYSRFLCDWNTRPIEDTLRAELARKDTELAGCQCAAHMRETELLTKQDTLGFDLDALQAELARKDEKIQILEKFFVIIANGHILEQSKYIENCQTELQKLKENK